MFGYKGFFIQSLGYDRLTNDYFARNEGYLLK